MNELYKEIELTPEQAEAIARGLIAVAKADGDIHPAEAALIAEFYASTTDNPANLGALERTSAIEGDVLATMLPEPEERELFIRTALLLAYADGEYGDGEKGVITNFAEAFAVNPEQLKEMEQGTKEFLLSQLSHLANTDAAADVAKDLKI